MLLDRLLPSSYIVAAAWQETSGARTFEGCVSQLVVCRVSVIVSVCGYQECTAVQKIDLMTKAKRSVF